MHRFARSRCRPSVSVCRSVVVALCFFVARYTLIRGRHARRRRPRAFGRSRLLVVVITPLTLLLCVSPFAARRCAALHSRAPALQPRLYLRAPQTLDLHAFLNVFGCNWFACNRQSTSNDPVRSVAIERRRTERGELVDGGRKLLVEMVPRELWRRLLLLNTDAYMTCETMQTTCNAQRWRVRRCALAARFWRESNTKTTAARRRARAAMRTYRKEI